MKIGTMAVVAALIGLYCMVEVEAASEPFLHESDVSSPPVVSMSQHFVFRGFDRRDGTRLAAWADDVTARLEGKLGRRIPFSRFDMIRLEGIASLKEPDGGLFVGQTGVEGALQQRVVVANPEKIEEEALLEAMVQVLLNRLILDVRGLEEPLPSRSLAPDWFSVGMAHALRAELRRRNEEFISEQWKASAAPSASSVLSLRTLPKGRQGEKAYCWGMVDWLGGLAPGEDPWMEMLRRFAAGKQVDVKWLSAQGSEWNGVQDVNKAWDLWLAQQSSTRRVLGEVGFEQVTSLKRLLDIRLIDYGLTPTDSLPARLKPADLIPYRTDRWARGIALRLAKALREEAVGQAPELAKVAEGYARYLDGFNAGQKGALGVTLLRARLETADFDLSRLEKKVALHSHFIRATETKVEHRAEEADVSAVRTPPETEVEKPSLEEQRRRLLDLLERDDP